MPLKLFGMNIERNNTHKEKLSFITSVLNKDDTAIKFFKIFVEKLTHHQTLVFA